MNALATAWFSFLGCALLIGVAGPTLSRNGDIIADRTGLSASWIGLVLLGTVTSLPELLTGVSSVTIAGAPDIAVGDALGSCVFNLLILVLVDYVYRETSVYSRANQGHILAAGFGVVMIGFVGLNIVVAKRSDGFAIGHVGFYSPIIVGLYLLALRTVFSYERQHREVFVEEASERYPGVTLPMAVRRFALASVLVVAAGVALPFAGNAIAEAMGWRQTFVGSMFVAAATSLPELVVTIAALRFGAVNLAVANLLGSNLFDVLIVAIDDVFYVKGPLLSDISPAHTASAASAVIMTGLVIVSLLYRPARRLFSMVGWTSLGLFGLYLFNSYVTFIYGD